MVKLAYPIGAGLPRRKCGGWRMCFAQPGQRQQRLECQFQQWQRQQRQP